MTEPDRTRTNGPALEKMYQFLLWLIPTVDKMPRSQNYAGGSHSKQGLGYTEKSD